MPEGCTAGPPGRLSQVYSIARVSCVGMPGHNRMEDLRMPWPYTGRERELDLVRRSIDPGRRGIVITGGPGAGKTRIVREATRGIDHTLVTGSRTLRGTPLAAFAP